jgi:hypothetical protein
VIINPKQTMEFSKMCISFETGDMYSGKINNNISIIIENDGYFPKYHNGVRFLN